MRVPGNILNAQHRFVAACWLFSMVALGGVALGSISSEPSPRLQMTEAIAKMPDYGAFVPESYSVDAIERNSVAAAWQIQLLDLVAKRALALNIHKHLDDLAVASRGNDAVCARIGNGFKATFAAAEREIDLLANELNVIPNVKFAQEIGDCVSPEVVFGLATRLQSLADVGAQVTPQRGRAAMEAMRLALSDFAQLGIKDQYLNQLNRLDDVTPLARWMVWLGIAAGGLAMLSGFPLLRAAIVQQLLRERHRRVHKNGTQASSIRPSASAPH